MYICIYICIHIYIYMHTHYIYIRIYNIYIYIYIVNPHRKSFIFILVCCNFLFGFGMLRAFSNSGRVQAANDRKGEAKTSKLLAQIRLEKVRGRWPWESTKNQPNMKTISIWVNYNDLTATSLEIMVSKGNHPQMALIQVSEIL